MALISTSAEGIAWPQGTERAQRGEEAHPRPLLPSGLLPASPLSPAQPGPWHPSPPAQGARVQRCRPLDGPA